MLHIIKPDEYYKICPQNGSQLLLTITNKFPSSVTFNFSDEYLPISIRGSQKLLIADELKSRMMALGDDDVNIVSLLTYLLIRLDIISTSRTDGEQR